MLQANFDHQKANVVRENGPLQINQERLLFHGSLFIRNIIEDGFDERHANVKAMYGAGKTTSHLDLFKVHFGDPSKAL